MRSPFRAALLPAVILLSSPRLTLADVTVVSRLTVTAQVPPELAEQAKTNRGTPTKSGTQTRILHTYYKGARQRLEVGPGKEVVINDLATNKRITLDPVKKTYYVVPLTEKKPAPPPSKDATDPTDESFKSAVTLAADLQADSGGARTVAGKPAAAYTYNVNFGLDMEKVLSKVKEAIAKEKADKEKVTAGSDAAPAEKKPAAEGEGVAGDAKKDDAGDTDFVTAMLSVIPSISMKIEGEQWVTDAVNLPVRWVSPTLFGAGVLATSSPLEETPLPPAVPVDLKEFMTKLTAIRGLPLSGRASFDVTIRFSDQAVALSKSHGDKKNQLPEGPIHIRVSLNNEVRSVREAPLGDSLFVVPKGYRKVTAPPKRSGLPGFPGSIL